jgi:hypothetical protein
MRFHVATGMVGLAVVVILTAVLPAFSVKRRNFGR